MCDIAVKNLRSLSHLLMSSCIERLSEADNIPLIAYDHKFCVINFKLKYALTTHKSHFCAKLTHFGLDAAGRIIAFHGTHAVHGPCVVYPWPSCICVCVLSVPDVLCLDLGYIFVKSSIVKDICYTILINVLIYLLTYIREGNSAVYESINRHDLQPILITALSRNTYDRVA